MKRFLMFGSLVLALTTAVAAQEVPSAVAVPNGDGRLAVETLEKGAAVSKGLKVEKKLTTRLPNGYRTVVSTSQKEDIYALQKEYGELIELLKLRIALLESELHGKIDSLLDEDQKKTLREKGSLISEKKKVAKK